MLERLGRNRVSPLKNAARLKTILSVFVRHGFHQVVERARLGSFILDRFTAPEVTGLSAAERLRLCFEKLGPTFVKLGQLLASRPDLIPTEFVEEFRKLHDQVPAMEFGVIRRTLMEHFAQEIEEIFSEFDPVPIGAASIAQVYQARLRDGTPVVVKVQRPGISQVIEEDLSMLRVLADLLESYVSEVRPFNPKAVVEEFARTLALETNFVIEANNIRRFQQNFADQPEIKIPHVYAEYTGRRVLVMERLEGIPLSHRNALDQEGIDPEIILKRGLRAYLKMVFTDGLFHGDLHAGNMFVLPNNQIGFIDFGVVGRLNHKTQGALANMLMALAEEDYDRLAYQYLDLAPYADQFDVDRFARDLRDLIAPYFGLTLRHVNVGRLLLDSTAVASRYGLVLPSELILFFKSIVTIEGMGRLIVKDFDFMTYALEFAGELVRTRYDAARMLRSFSEVSRDTNALLSTLPRQIRQTLRRWNSPDYQMKISVAEIHVIRRSIEKASNLTFLGLVISGLLLSGAMFMQNGLGPWVMGLPLLSAISIGLAAFLGVVAFYNYFKR